jgi:hypothetical protein
MNPARSTWEAIVEKSQSTNDRTIRSKPGSADTNSPPNTRRTGMARATPTAAAPACRPWRDILCQWTSSGVSIIAPTAAFTPLAASPMA